MYHHHLMEQHHIWCCNQAIPIHPVDRCDYIGACGRVSPNCKCVPDCTFLIGSGPDAYDNIVDYFKNGVKAYMSRVIILNPLHPHLPPCVVYLACNRLTHEEVVMKQWTEVEQLLDNNNSAGVRNFPWRVRFHP